MTKSWFYRPYWKEERNKRSGDMQIVHKASRVDSETGRITRRPKNEYAFQTVSSVVFSQMPVCSGFCSTRPSCFAHIRDSIRASELARYRCPIELNRVTLLMPQKDADRCALAISWANQLPQHQVIIPHTIWQAAQSADLW